MNNILKLKTCSIEYDTLLICLGVLVSLVYVINMLNNKYVDDKYGNGVEDSNGNANDDTNNNIIEKFDDHASGNQGISDQQRRIDMITTALSSFRDSKQELEEKNDEYNELTIDLDQAIANNADSNTRALLNTQINNASSSILILSQTVNNNEAQLLNLKARYPTEYALVVTGSNAIEFEDENITHAQPNIIHNHYNQYFGGNPQMTKFLQQLTNQLQENKQEGDLTLMDQGMCSELNNKLSTMTLAEFKNNRFVQDLKSRCEKSDGVDCSFRPTNSQTALLGTLLEDAGRTKVGDILPKEDITTNYI
jgi:hypothetical protein